MSVSKKDVVNVVHFILHWFKFNGLFKKIVIVLRIREKGKRTFCSFYFFSTTQQELLDYILCKIYQLMKNDKVKFRFEIY